MRQYNDLKKMMDVAAGRRKASLVLKGGTIVNVFTERTEIGDIAIEDGCIAGIGEYDGLVNVDMTGRYICPVLLTGIYILKVPWCRRRSLKKQSFPMAPPP